jgi:outer membrane protein assembly factor BamB
MNTEFQLRIRPAILILAFCAFMTFVPGMIAPRTRLHFGGMAGGWMITILATGIWWVFRSGVKGGMRWLPVILVLAVATIATVLYPNINLGLRVLFCVLLAVLMWLVAAILTKPAGWTVQRGAIVGALVIALLTTVAIRIDGTNVELVPELSLRWQPTSEQLAKAERGASGEKVEGSKLTLVAAPDDWTQFRGAKQDSRLTGVTIRTDWEKNPPKELWKRRIGPGWGSMTLVGDYLFTQEQREGNEAVVCLKADTGKEVWAYETPGRFAEAISGVGPRGTPTFHDGSLYTFGGMGTLTKLNAHDGQKIWEVETPAATDTKPPTPFWGYASSPVVIGDVVVVFINGGNGKGTAAFRTKDGGVAWTAGIGTHGYSTAHVATLCGVEQLLMASDKALESYDPKSGTVLWTHVWSTSGNRATQPILLGNDELLLTTGYSKGTQRLKITKSADAWNVSVLWESTKLKPYYNDSVLHNGLIYGFDDKAFVCFDPKTGKHRWNEGNVYGMGQVLLLADQNLLLVQAENGNVVLVETNGDEHMPVAKFKALTGKTWNHPVIHRGKLYVRNGEEIGCFDVSK